VNTVQGNRQTERDFAEDLEICRRNGWRIAEAHCLFMGGYSYDMKRTAAAYAESLAVLESIGCVETDLGASVLAYLARSLCFLGERERPRQFYAKALTYYRKIGNWATWAACATWAYYAYPEAENLGPADEALAYLRDHEPESHLLYILNRAETEWSLGHYETAESLAREALSHAQRVNEQNYAAFAQLLITKCATSQGRLEQAAQLWKEVAAIDKDEQEISDWKKASTLVGLAFYLTRLGQPSASDCTARLLGAADGIYQILHLGDVQREQDEHDAALAAAREGLGEEAFALAWAEGKAMSLWQAYLYGMKSAGFLEE
jgi:tetratricopeptide (TPR) repeat protein